MANSPDSPDEKKVFDVAKPGSAKPDIGSKPMIIGHKSLASDPMMRQQEAEEIPSDKTSTKVDETEKSANSSSEPVTSTAEKKIEPITKTDDNNENSINIKDSDSTEITPEPLTETIVEKSETTPDSKDAVLEENEPTNNEEKSTEALGSDQKKAELDPTAIALEREENLRKMIESKKYHVPVKKSNHRSASSWIASIFGLLVVLAVGLFLLIDTGIVDIGVKLPFRIFGQEETTQTESTTPAPVTPQNEEAKEEPVESTTTLTERSAVVEYQIEIPDDWLFNREVTKISYPGESSEEYFKDSYTLPSGAVLTIETNAGGKGGYCEPAEDDVPHQPGNECNTYELSDIEEIDVATAESTLAADTTALFVKGRFTDITGDSKYFLCIETRYDDLDPAGNLIENQPVMGAYFYGCAGINSDKHGSIETSIENVDNTTPAYFENEDVLAIEEALKTFKLL